MPNKAHHAPQMSNFWTGFTVGATVLFFLGTKKGRSTLKGMMDYAENLEDNLEEMMKMTTDDTQSKMKSFTGATNISDLISKIQSVLPDQKQVKNFFEKGGKMLKS